MHVRVYLVVKACQKSSLLMQHIYHSRLHRLRKWEESTCVCGSAFVVENERKYKAFTIKRFKA
jgi:hypothetical protein